MKKRLLAVLAFTLLSTAVLTMPVDTKAKGTYPGSYADKKCNNPDAPCIAEMFSSVVAEPSNTLTEAAASTLTYTCGVSVRSPAGVVVSKLWQVMTATWGGNCHND